MENRKIKCSIAGLGRIGSTLEFDKKREKPASHAGAVSSHEECIIAAGCDKDREKCEKFKKDWNCSKVFTSFNEMLKTVETDILHIATPPESHRMMLETALAENIPVIILEKPVADSLKDAVKMEKCAAKSESRIIINHERRYSLQYRRIRSIISENVFGSLLSLETKMYMGRTRTLSGMIYDDGTHIIDLANYLCGSDMKIRSVNGSESAGYVYVSAEAGNVPVLMEFARGRDHLLFEIDLSFERGRIVAGNGYYHEFESEESMYYENFRSLEDKGVSFQKSGYFAGMFDDAVRCFKDRDARPVSGISNGVTAVRIINGILRRI